MPGVVAVVVVAVVVVLCLSIPVVRISGQSEGFTP